MKFIRTDVSRFSKLGKNRKKLQKWRRAAGRHNKIRKKRFGYPVKPEVGYKTAKVESGLVNGKVPILVKNMQDIENAGSNSILIISRTLGAKKKMEILKKANERKLEIANLRKEKK